MSVSSDLSKLPTMPAEVGNIQQNWNNHKAAIGALAVVAVINSAEAVVPVALVGGWGFLLAVPFFIGAVANGGSAIYGLVGNHEDEKTFFHKIPVIHSLDDIKANFSKNKISVIVKVAFAALGMLLAAKAAAAGMVFAPLVVLWISFSLANLAFDNLFYEKQSEWACQGCKLG